MYGVFWHAVVMPGRMQEVLEFLEWDVQVARESEPKTASFDVYVDPEDPNGLYVYEAYQDEAAFGEHRANEPFQKFSAGGLRDELFGEMKIISAFSNSIVSKGCPTAG